MARMSDQPDQAPKQEPAEPSGLRRLGSTLFTGLGVLCFVPSFYVTILEWGRWHSETGPQGMMMLPCCAVPATLCFIAAWRLAATP
jgi:hypothetical protein